MATKGFKPIPDEEGTEIWLVTRMDELNNARFKPIPDEEGTEIFVVG